MKFQQASRLQGVRYDVRGRNMVAAQEMEARGEKIMHLNIGNLKLFGFDTPPSVRRSVIAHMEQRRATPTLRACTARGRRSLTITKPRA